MRWEDVLKRDDIVGGDIEIKREGSIFRGPISQIRLTDGRVFFEMRWTARMDGGKWKRWPATLASSFRVGDAQLQDIGRGRVMFVAPLLGMGVIFPKGGDKLDPAKVEGLQLAEA